MLVNPESFRTTTPPRIMGGETEYTSRYTPDFGADCTREVLKEYARHPEEYALYNDETREAWLHNGARLYVDYGDVLEYATPECLQPRAVAMYEKAGECIVSDINRAAALDLDDGSLDRGNTYKRSGYGLTINPSSPEGKPLLNPGSVGHHESYYSPLAGDLANQVATENATRGLLAYLFSRHAWAGTGLVNTEGFQPSQKAPAINFTHSGKSTEHGDKSPYCAWRGDSRLEIRLGDGNMSDWAMINKFAQTSLLLRMLEHERFPEELMISADYSTTEAYHSAGRDELVHLEGGEYVTPAEHQQRIAQAALRFASDFPNTPKDEQMAASEIYEVCNDIDLARRDPQLLQHLSGKVDWVAKYLYLVSRGLPKEWEELNTRNLEAVACDLQWEDIASNGIARRWYRKRMSKPYRIADADITYAKTHAPNTRAHNRADIVAHSSGQFGVSWDSIRFGGERYTMELSNPYANSNDMVL